MKCNCHETDHCNAMHAKEFFFLIKFIVIVIITQICFLFLIIFNKKNKFVANNQKKNEKLQGYASKLSLYSFTIKFN